MRPCLWIPCAFYASPFFPVATAASAGLGPRLAALRKPAGYTQQQLADEIGASR